MMIAWNLIYEISSGVDMARIRTIKPTFGLMRTWLTFQRRHVYWRLVY